MKYLHCKESNVSILYQDLSITIFHALKKIIYLLECMPFIVSLFTNYFFCKHNRIICNDKYGLRCSLSCLPLHDDFAPNREDMGLIQVKHIVLSNAYVLKSWSNSVKHTHDEFFSHANLAQALNPLTNCLHVSVAI